MGTKTPFRYTLDHDGRRLEVEFSSAGLASTARLLVAGEQVAEQTTRGDSATLRAEGIKVEVRWGWLGQVTRCELRSSGIAFDPPPGSRAARLLELAEARPTLYASRHVVLAVGRIVLPLLGLGVLFRFVAPALPLPSIPVPEVDLPSIPWPDLDLPSIPWPGWVRAIIESSKYWGPVLFGLLIAADEVRKRRRKAAARAGSASSDAGDNTTSTTNSTTNSNSGNSADNER
ncbi:hypothetical protein [Embleya sp. NBC_00896]|uniref:hypothetical protein n=1 Tax=Embleya sp. NBC_00896 TaxID=2975961 RepID=UPI003863D0AF|nr:hypothetical protein OG928_02295 [Embleya sp. NBC_00896]